MGKKDPVRDQVWHVVFTGGGPLDGGCVRRRDLAPRHLIGVEDGPFAGHQVYALVATDPDASVATMEYQGEFWGPNLS